jgi:hypothetical protein
MHEKSTFPQFPLLGENGNFFLKEESLFSLMEKLALWLSNFYLCL